MPLKKFSRLLLLFILFISISSALAQESQPIATQKLVERAQKIATGEVVSKYSAWGSEGREIYTYITLRVDRIIKSNREDSLITIRQLGGRVGDIQSNVAGMPKFEIGESVLVFLGPFTDTEYYGVIDWFAGKYVIKKDKSTRTILHGGGEGNRQRVDEFVTTLRRYL